MKYFLYFFSFVIYCSSSFGQKNEMQSPEDFLPHAYQKEFTPHHLLVDYFQHIAENSDQVLLQEYGRTNEKRPLLLAMISSKNNIQNIEKIRKSNLINAGLLEGKKEWDKDVAIVWLGYSVHGNEAAGSESSMAVLHQLANKENKDIQSWLENTIVLMDPAINPDGYSRYTHWNNQVSNTINNLHGDAIEHNEPWPGGRMNHYYFDLNRDWAWLSQLESRQRVKVYNEWMPHVVADLHEMGANSPYYFAPAAQPFHKYITPFQSDFQMTVGKNHAKYFDENGWLYFTREVFDLLYPSYGDTYPIFSGAIGMTYEQGGSGFAGRAVKTDNEEVLRLEDRMEHHITTSLSTVEISSKNAKSLTTNFQQYYNDAKNNPAGKYKGFVIKASNPIGKINALKKLLDQHGIDYGQGNESKSKNGFSYKDGRQKSFSINKEDLVISAHQARGTLVQVLFEPDTYVVDSLTYDITAWSIPFAFGLDAYAVTDKLEVKPFKNKTNSSTSKIEDAYAYVVPWESVESVKILSDLMKAGIRVRTASGSFTIDGKGYNPGTVIVTRADNKKIENLNDKINSIAQAHSNMIQPLKTGLSQKGYDLGSSQNDLLKPINAITIRGNSVSPYSFGQIWHFFEEQIEYPLTIVEKDQLKNANMDRYTHLILPEGWYRFNDKEFEMISDWVNDGGNVIAIGRSMTGFMDKSGFAIKRKTFEKSEDENEKKKEETVHYSSLERKGISNSISGAIVRLSIDNTHPLAFGIGNVYHSLKTSAAAFEKLDQGWNVASWDDNNQVYGFIGANAKKKLKNTLVFGVQNKGRGSITYLVDNPLYRSFWEEGKLLFSNALFQVSR